MTIEQALYGSRDSAGYRFLAQSPGFKDEWLPLAQKLCTGFGELPPGAKCPEALFVQPLGKNEIAVVRVADRGADDAGRPGTLAFHLLVMPREDYEHLGGDPFAIADLFPAAWSPPGDLPTLSPPTDPAPPRTVDQLQKVLQEGDTPTLLGATQALVDGSRFVVQRQAPEPKLLRDVWALLPTRTRFELWPATFAVNNAGAFHAVVVPAVNTNLFPNHVTEQGAGEYPEGRYELGLQIAVESGDQAGVDRMLARRTSRDTFKYMLILLVASALIVLVSNWLVPTPEPPPPTTARKPGEVASEVNLPAADKYPPLGDEERAELTKRLHAFAGRIKAETGKDMTAEELVHAIDLKLGTPDETRQGGSLLNVKPVQRALAILLYKHHVERYNDLSLNSLELLERLEKKIGESERKP